VPGERCYGAGDEGVAPSLLSNEPDGAPHETRRFEPIPPHKQGQVTGMVRWVADVYLRPPLPGWALKSGEDVKGIERNRQGETTQETRAMRMVATVVALVLLVSNIYGDRENLGRVDNKLMRDLDVCFVEAPMIGLKDITMKDPMTICRCMTHKGHRFY
jgi:hypothetical protein